MAGWSGLEPPCHLATASFDKVDGSGRHAAATIGNLERADAAESRVTNGKVVDRQTPFGAVSARKWVIRWRLRDLNFSILDPAVYDAWLDPATPEPKALLDRNLDGVLYVARWRKKCSLA